MRRFTYNFPATRFVTGVNDLTRRGQADQITQEAAEAFSAAEKGDKLQYIIELLDCMQACETALREFDEGTVNTARLKVIGINQARGYYEDGALEAHVVSDDVDRPSHYTSGAHEAIEVIESVIEGLPAREAYCLASVLKYSLRAGLKDDFESDVAKANNFAHRLVRGCWRWQGFGNGLADTKVST